VFDCPTPAINQTLAAAGSHTAQRLRDGRGRFAAAKLVQIDLDVTAAAGGPGSRCGVVIEQSADGSTWTPRAGFQPASGVTLRQLLNHSRASSPGPKSSK
jgi:hypothetical protein